MEVSPERHRLCFDILRRVRGVKNSEIAKKAKISHQTILNWRRPVKDGGTRLPRVDTLERVGRAYGLKLQFIDRHEEKRAESRPSAGYHASAVHSPR